MKTNAVNASSALPDGTKLDGIRGCVHFCWATSSKFAGALTKKLLAYALGRNVEYFDRRRSGTSRDSRCQRLPCHPLLKNR